MILYFKGFPQRHHQANAFKVFVNSFLFISSLTSLFFGQIFAVSPAGYPSYSTREKSGDIDLGFNANFPVDKPSDIVLGGLFPMHNKNITEHGSTCGSLNVERGIHRFQAAIFAIKEINKNPYLLPNITLGMSAYDTCGRDTRALEESLKFVMESLAKNRTVSCPNAFSASSSMKERIMAGVVGAAASTVSIQIANLLRLFKLPQISYASTSTDLSDKAKYDFFVRTVPPDSYQARAMIDVVRGLKWTSVFAVSSEGNYGERGIREFINGAKAANICIAGTFKIDGGSSGYEQIASMVKEFLKRQNVRGIILFCTDTDARRILQEAKHQDAAGKFTWIASDYWGTRKKTIDGLEKYAEGAITISLTEANFTSFKQYFTSLKPTNHSLRVNPWFEEFWETQFNCRMSESACRSRSLKDMDMRIDDKVPFVIDAVYAFAHGLDAMYKSFCPARNGLCPELMRRFDGNQLRDILFNVSFTGVTGSVSFDRNGNGPGRYDIYRLQGGKYVKIASWDDKLYDAQKLYDGTKNGTALSRCGVPCTAGHYKVFDFDGSCCWTCKKCPENNYVQGIFYYINLSYSKTGNKTLVLHHCLKKN